MTAGKRSEALAADALSVARLDDLADRIGHVAVPAALAVVTAVSESVRIVD